MAGHKQHDFHILTPSVWPFLAAMGAFTMLSGAVLWMNDVTPWVFAAGVAVVIYSAIGWWTDVAREGVSGDHTPVVRIGLRYGMILFIMSEVMFFVAWFWMYFKHALFPMKSEAYPSGGVWPPAHVELPDPFGLPLLNTLILLTSGAAVTWAHHAIMENDRKGLVNGLLIAIVLGIAFTAIQGYEYFEIIANALFVNPEDAETGWIFGSSFFMATGFHGMHVIIGTIFLTVCLGIALSGRFTPESHVGFEAAAWYWHFVDVVWLFLFAGVYVGSAWGL